MKSSDIAFLRQIAAGLSAVEEINKNAVKLSLEKHIDTFREVLNDKENTGVGFKGLSSMNKNQVLKLANTKMLIFKDSNDFYVPFEISTIEKIKIVPKMLRDENFSDAITYVGKTKDELQGAIKNKIKNSESIKEAIKIANLSMTKIFNMKTIEEKNNILKLVGINDFEKILEHYDIQKSLNFRVTKEDYQDEWITDNITKIIKEEYQDLKNLLMSNPSAIEVFAETKKLLKEIDGVYNNYELDKMVNNEDVTSFFNVGNREILVLKESVSNANYDPLYHNITIKKQDALSVIKEKKLEEEYPIEQKEEIKIFQPANTIDDLKFGLLEYLSYQAEMKNDFKMMKQAEFLEKQQKTKRGYGYEL